VRDKYLRANGNKHWGRSPGEESQYLLTGLARCGCCRGGLYVRSRSHGKRRAFFYGCTSFHRKGRAVCKNGHEVPMEPFNAAVLGALENYVLSPKIVEAVVVRAIELLEQGTPKKSGEAVGRDLAGIEAEIRRLSHAIAKGGTLSGLLEALQQREERRDELLRRLDAARNPQVPTQLAAGEIRRRVENALADWGGLLNRRVSNGRHILRKLLDGPIICTPLPHVDTRGYEFRAKVNLGPMVAGILKIGERFAGATSVASPTGFANMWKRKLAGIMRKPARWSRVGRQNTA
jgi:Recombinase zinc beta ribbon domain